MLEADLLTMGEIQDFQLSNVSRQLGDIESLSLTLDDGYFRTDLIFDNEFDFTSLPLKIEELTLVNPVPTSSREAVLLEPRKYNTRIERKLETRWSFQVGSRMVKLEDRKDE